MATTDETTVLMSTEVDNETENETNKEVKKCIIDSVLIKGGESGNIGHKEIVVMVSPVENPNSSEWASLGTVEGDAGIPRTKSQGKINIYGKIGNIRHALVAECIKCHEKQKFTPKITSTGITGKSDSIRILFRNDFYRAVCNRNRLQKKDVSIEVRNFGTTSLNYKTKKRRTGFTGTSEHLMHITKIKQSGTPTNALDITEITSEMMKKADFSSGMKAKMKHEHPKDFLIAAICYMNKIEDYNLQFIGDNNRTATGVSNKSTIDKSKIQTTDGRKTRRFKK